MNNTIKNNINIHHNFKCYYDIVEYFFVFSNQKTSLQLFKFKKLKTCAQLRYKYTEIISVVELLFYISYIAKQLTVFFIILYTYVTKYILFIQIAH